MRKDRRNPFADRPGKIRFDHDFARCRILQSAYHHILKRCRQREHRQLCVGRADFGYDHGAQICANDIDQAIMIGCLLGGERDALAECADAEQWEEKVKLKGGGHAQEEAA